MSVSKTVFSPLQLEKLEAIFSQDSTPGKKVKEFIAFDLGLELKAVQVWFNNRAQRGKRKGEYQSQRNVQDIRHLDYQPTKQQNLPGLLTQSNLNQKTDDHLKKSKVSSRKGRRKSHVTALVNKVSERQAEANASHQPEFGFITDQFTEYAQFIAWKRELLQECFKELLNF